MPTVPVLSTSSASSKQKPSGTNKKKSKTNLSPEAAQIEYLTTELNFTHSKIAMQDNTIKDFEHKVKILREKLNITEEKLNSDLHKKYFGDTTPGLSASTSSCPCSSGAVSAPPYKPCQHLFNNNCPAISVCCNHIDAARSKTDHTNCVDKAAVTSLSIDIESLKAAIIQVKPILSGLVPKSITENPCLQPKHQKDTTNPDHDIIEVVADIHCQDCSDISISSVEAMIPSPN